MSVLLSLQMNQDFGVRPKQVGDVKCQNLIYLIACSVSFTMSMSKSITEVLILTFVWKISKCINERCHCCVIWLNTKRDIIDH